MVVTPAVILLSLPLLAFVAVCWDLGRRYIEGYSRVSKQARDELLALVNRHDDATERTDKAIANFIAQVRDLVNYTERNRREAESQLLANNTRRRP